MARSLRIDVPDGWYHVLIRGVERRQIFPDERSNVHFLELLGCLPSRFGVQIHGYVLMGNHYHLQLQTPQANLSRAMQWLNLSYGAWFNRRWQRSGPLVQGRFKAILHEPENTALIINRYIHLNPVRVRALGGHEARPDEERQLEVSGTGPSRELVKARVEALSSYRWSSYPAYVGGVRNPGWLTTESEKRSIGSNLNVQHYSCLEAAVPSKNCTLWRAHCVSMCRMVGIMYSTGGWNAGKSFPTRGRTHIF
jgi:putative transposase